MKQDPITLSEGFRGAGMVLDHGRVIFEQAAGFADLPNEIPNRMTTRFASASAGKAFVAVGVLQQIGRGRLGFQDKLGELLELDMGGIDPEVTVEQLLTHTSGVPDYFDESVMREYEELWTDFPNYKIRRNADLFPLFFHKPMMYPRGERFQYNNSGYVLLAQVLETVTGLPFDRYLQQAVFQPCGMDSTGYFELDRLPAGCAQNYIYCPDTNSYRTNIFSVDAKGTGAGGAFITVEDIARFWQSLQNGKLLPPDLAEAMLSRHSGDGSDPEEGYYGYGVWIIDNRPGRDIAYFQGCDPGVSFLSEYHPERDIISVFVSNYGDNVWQEMRKVRKSLY